MRIYELLCHGRGGCSKDAPRGWCWPQDGAAYFSKDNKGLSNTLATIHVVIVYTFLFASILAFILLDPLESKVVAKLLHLGHIPRPPILYLSICICIYVIGCMICLLDMYSYCSCVYLHELSPYVISFPCGLVDSRSSTSSAIAAHLS